MDRPEALALRAFAQAEMGPLLLVHGILLVALAWAALRGAPPQRPWRGGWGLALGILLAGAVVVRVVVFPVARHVFDGHEADYYDAFRGEPLPEAMGYRFYPALSTLYRALGIALGGSGEALVALSVAVGIAVLVLAARWVYALSGDRALALLVALFVAADPGHAFWSSSAYNVMIPLAFSLGALLAVERALARGSPSALALAGLLWVAAVATRLESVLFGLPMAAQLLTSRGLRGMRPGAVAWAAAPSAILGLWHAAALGLHVPRPEGADSPLDYAGAMFDLQWSYLAPFGPWGEAGPLLLGAVGLGLLIASGRGRRAAGVLASLLPLHFIYAVFDDYGTRHTLLPRLAIMLGAAACVLAGLRWARPGGGRVAAGLAAAAGALIIVGAPVARGLADGNTRYYATPDLFLASEPAFRGAPYTRPDTYASGCVFVSESAFYRSWRQASHFEIMDPDSFKRLYDQYDGCLIFVYDLENFQRSSRAIDERAAKLRAFFPMTLMGKRLRPDLEDYSLLYAIGPREGSGRAPAGVD